MKKILLILSYVVLLSIGTFFSLKVFETFFFNKHLIETPNLKGLTLDKSSILLHNTGLKIEKMGEAFSELPENQIYSQEPKAGKKIKKGRILKVWVSRGKNTVVVPDFRDMNILDAKVLAEQKGFKIKNTVHTNHNLRYNRVVATEPASGSIVTGDKEISFLVSLNKKEDTIRMPEVIGLSIEEARSLLRRNQIFIGEVTYMDNFNLESGIIVESSIERGEKIAAGSSVDIIVTK